MPTKKTKTGQQYRIDGKRFEWTPEEGGDPITIPLRMKLRILRGMAGKDLDDVGTMFDLLDAIAPGQGDALDDLDVNEFQRMFEAWQTEYTSLNGASLGEAPGSPS